MCYDARQYALKLEKMEAHYGGISSDRSAWNPSYSVSAFSQGRIAALTANQPYEIQMLKWGWYPRYALNLKESKDREAAKKRTLNCRLDTLLENLKSRTHTIYKEVIDKPCIILMDGFFEYHTLANDSKVPYYISMKDCFTFPVAGFYNSWTEGGDPSRIHTGITLGTTGANPLLKLVHNKPKFSTDLRMPAILLPEEMKKWLDISKPIEERLSIIRSYPAGEMEAYTVVNFKKSGFKGSETALEPLDYAIPGLPTRLDGANLPSFISTGPQELFS